MEDLKCKNGNPGAVKYGNFINYYQFHSVDARVEHLAKLPDSIWNISEPCHALDLGCNTGDLTVALYKFLKEKTKKECHMLGVDIDPSLVACAKQKEDKNSKFLCLDFMDDEQRRPVIDYLTINNIDHYNVIFCFSLTMWIHLNHSDEGLRIFLREIAKLGKILVIEAQPWKCYASAIRRIKKTTKSKSDPFPFYQILQMRSKIEEDIEDFLKTECNCEKLAETTRIEWDRKIMIFRSNSILR